MVGKMAMGQVFHPVLLLSPVSISQLMHHFNLYLHVGITSTTNGRSLRIFQKAMGEEVLK
jgi:hypothetical protein